ncbi:MAG TPA: wax ester/triacylglycerol synthase family O-acyltransferase [Bryobacteraceae bacterium]|nr:wax ester/triacylglycerol synthase family O-acyltransferase [Bryobacteraceae bacterium]
MTSSRPSDRLSAQDALFLYLDTQEMPLHIASVMVFDGPIPLRECTELIRSRLPLIPRYLQRIAVPPLNVGHPTWEFDPEFDIRRHVTEIALKKGTEHELQVLVGKVLSAQMDRSRPLWDLTLVNGLKGGRGAMIARVHHCLVDGVAGVALMNVLLGPTPSTPPPPKAKTPSPPLPDPITSFFDGLISSYADMFGRVFQVQSAAINMAESMVSEGVPALTQLLQTIPDLLNPVDRLPFNQPCPGPRRLVWTEIAIPDVKKIREKFGGTLNDVVLTLVIAAVREYTQLHGQAVDKRLARVMVPVNIRHESPLNGLGNHISMIPASLPLDIEDPVELLANIHKRMDLMKRARVADLVSLVGTWLGVTPVPVQALLVPFATSMLPALVPPFNLVCTNVPGPPVPLYALGRKMISDYPYVPVGADMGICVAIQSYNDKLFFGFTGSEAAAPDVNLMPRMLERIFAQLRRAAGVRTVRLRKPRAKKPAEPEPAPVPVSVAATVVHPTAA